MGFRSFVARRVLSVVRMFLTDLVTEPSTDCIALERYTGNFPFGVML